MGNKSSRSARLNGKNSKISATEAIEGHLAAALKEMAASSERLSFNRFMLRAPPLMSVALVRCQAVFQGLDSDGNGALSMAELQQGCSRLGYHLSDDLIQQIFVSVDADGSNSLNLREFVGALCLLHVLKGPHDRESVDPAILQAFNAAITAFVSLDASHDGYISLTELRSAMHEKGTSRISLVDGSDPTHAESWVEKRFREMDVRHDNRASFLAFLFWLARFSVVEEDEEEEEEDDDDEDQKDTEDDEVEAKCPWD